MELDALYCDVVVKRWEEFTGKKAQRPGHAKAGAAPRRREARAKGARARQGG